MSSASSGDAASPAALVSGYRPWLDGVRALAVTGVVVQHASSQNKIDLSSAGVGLFFGLSGYLITSLLMGERARRGAVSLSRFYIRRAARLFPALLIVVAVCNLIFVLQGDLKPLRGSLAALTYTSNYAQIVKGDFVIGYGPTWTLSVEEHFYLLWPLLLLWVIRRWGLQAALRATLAVCVGALAWRALLAALSSEDALLADGSLLAIGSLERADALLYGCAAAIALRLGWRPGRWVFWAGVMALACVPFAFPHGDTRLVAVGGQAALGLAAAAVVVGLDYSAPEWVRRGLSVRPIVTVGVLSYGIYLWHGPMMRIAVNFGGTTVAWHFVAGLVSVAAAAVSYRFFEAPIRAWARSRTEAPIRAWARSRTL